MWRTYRKNKLWVTRIARAGFIVGLCGLLLELFRSLYKHRAEDMSCVFLLAESEIANKSEAILSAAALTLRKQMNKQALSKQIPTCAI